MTALAALAGLICLAAGVALILRHRAKRYRICLNCGRPASQCPGCAYRPMPDRLGDRR